MLIGAEHQNINFGSEFQQFLDNLPSSLTHLSVISYFYKHPVDYLPQNLNFLTLLTSYLPQMNFLPPNLYYLNVSYASVYQAVFAPIYLPDTITHLKLPSCFNHESLDFLPSSLKHLTIYPRFWFCFILVKILIKMWTTYLKHSNISDLENRSIAELIISQIHS